MIHDWSGHTSDLYQNNVAEFFIEWEVCLYRIDLWYKLNRFKLNSSLHANPNPKPGTRKTGFGQVKSMKEFVWINRNFSTFGFRASRWKILRQRLLNRFKFNRTEPLPVAKFIAILNFTWINGKHNYYWFSVIWQELKQPGCIIIGCIM